MSFVKGLACKECGTEYAALPRMMCDECFGPVEVRYDYEAMAGIVTRETIAAGPRSLWRYRDLLPVEGEPVTGLRSGMTPLVRAERLGRELGVKELYIKDDGANYPTYSYKDRVVPVALTRAVELGFDAVGCASTGNLAHSVAAHAAAAGLRALVVIPYDLEEGKVTGTLVFGPEMVKVRGSYDDVNRLCTQVADEYGWAIVNVSLRPWYTEGAKTHGFEIAEQLGWRLPRHTVVPVAGGTILPKVWKAYRELRHPRPRRGRRPAHPRRPGRRLRSGRARDRRGKGHHRAPEAQDPRQEHRDREPRRRVLRDPGRPRVRRLRRLGRRSRDPRGDRPPRADGRDLHGARRRHDARRDHQADRERAHTEGRVDLRVDHRERSKTVEAQAKRLPPVPVIEARLEAFAEVVGRLAPARRQETSAR